MAIGKASARFVAQRAAKEAQRQAQVHRLHEQGVRLPVIAKSVKLSISAVINILASKHSQPENRAPEIIRIVIASEQRARLVNVEKESRRARLMCDVVQRYISGDSTATIAVACGVSSHEVRALLKQSGVPLRSGRPQASKNGPQVAVTIPPTDLHPTEDDAVQLYQRGLSVQQVAAALLVTPHMVRRVIVSRGLNRSAGQRTQSRHPLTERDAKIAEAYRSGMTMAAIGKELGLSRERVRQLLATAEEPSRPMGSSKMTDELLQRAIALYQQGHRQDAVAKMVGVTAMTLRRWFRQRGVPFRRSGKSANPAVSERNKAMAQLYEKGERIVDIARAFKLTPHSVWNCIARAGGKPRTRRTRARKRRP